MSFCAQPAHRYGGATSGASVNSKITCAASASTSGYNGAVSG